MAPRAHLAIFMGIALYVAFAASGTLATRFAHALSEDRKTTKREADWNEHQLPSLRARIKFNGGDGSSKNGHTSNGESWPDIVIPLRRIAKNETVEVPIRHPNGEVETVSVPVLQREYQGTVPVLDNMLRRGSVAGVQFSNNGQLLRASWNMTFPAGGSGGLGARQGLVRHLHSKTAHTNRHGNVNGYALESDHQGTTSLTDDKLNFPRTLSSNTDSPKSSSDLHYGVSTPSSLVPVTRSGFPARDTSLNIRTQSPPNPVQWHHNISMQRTSTDLLLRPSHSRTLNLVELYNSTRRRNGRHGLFSAKHHVKNDLAKESLIAVHNSNTNLKGHISSGLSTQSSANDGNQKVILSGRADYKTGQQDIASSHFSPSTTPSRKKGKKSRRDRKQKDPENTKAKANGSSRKRHRNGKKDKSKENSDAHHAAKRQRKMGRKSEVQQDEPSNANVPSSSSASVSSWTYQVSGRGNTDQKSVKPEVHPLQPSSLDTENEESTDDNTIEEDDRPLPPSPIATESTLKKDFFHPVAHPMQIGLRLYIADSASNCLQCPNDRVVVAKKGMKCGLFLFSALLPCSSEHGGTGVRLISQSRRVRRVLPEGSHTVILRIIKGQPNSPRTNLQTCIFKYTVRVNRCEIPPPFLNGVLNCTQGRAWGSQCSFLCNHGYELIGEKSVSCNGDDAGVQWSHPLPHCVATHCPKPEKFANGFHSCHTENEGVSEQYRRGTVCHHVCDDGFVLPTSFLTYESTKCIGPSWTHDGHNVECRKQLPPIPTSGHCVPQQLEASNNSLAVVPKAEFISADGKRECAVVCALDGPLGPGVYENVCEATDSELRTTHLCRYSVEVLGVSCAAPMSIPHGSLQCPDLPNEAYPVGTICQYVCSTSHVIPTSQLDIIDLICRDNQTWNNTKKPECKRQIPPDLIPGSCNDYSTLTKNPHQVVLPVPEFATSSGSEAVISCNNSQVSHSSLQFKNYCTATDPELRINSTCFYGVDVKVVSCEALSSPLNGQMTCSLQGDAYRCDVKCLERHHFASPFELPKGHVQCNLESGLWDFQTKYDITDVPDCLREMYTSLQTDLHFNVSTTYTCEDEDAVDLVKQNIQQHLFSRNRVICDQVDCTDLTYLCFHIRSTDSSILETVWNVMANFTVETDYYDYDSEKEEPEAEFLLEQIQTETHKLVTYDESFHEDLEQLGATIMEESYHQSKIELVCAEQGFFVDQISLYCLQCPRGTYFHNRACSPCPENTYQDEMGKLGCKPCPPGTLSEREAKSKAECLQEELKDPCEAQPCQNGGTCINDNGSLLCVCTTGYKGDFCEDGCAPDFCQNGGSCISEKGSFRCLCSDGFSGPHCESTTGHAPLSDGRSVSAAFYRHRHTPLHQGWRLHPCVASPCHEGATCIPVAAQPYYLCQCPTGRTGFHCEHRQCPLAYHNFCYNGASCAIMAETQAWVCLCREGFMGPRCEIRDGASAENHGGQGLYQNFQLHSMRRRLPDQQHDT